MGNDFSKMDLVQLHRLFDVTGMFLLDERGIDSFPREFFPVYGDLGVKGQDVFASRDDHKQAVLTLSRSLADFAGSGEDGLYAGFLERDDFDDLDDELKINLIGDHFSRKGLGRKEAAEKVSEQVDFTFDTVYEKFSENDIYFSFHGDSREEAVDLLESYAEENHERSRALKEFSEELDVPEGTLKNWLTDEEIVFTEDVSALVEPESKKELIETAEHYFDIENGIEPIEQALGRNIDTLRCYRDNNIETMPLELLDSLDRLFESEPMFRMDDPDRYIEEDTRYGLKLDDEFQSFLFSHVSGEDFEGMTGKSPSTLTRYRNNRSKTVKQEAYRKAFQTVSYMYSKKPEPEITEYVHRQRFGSGASPEKVEVDKP